MLKRLDKLCSASLTAYLRAVKTAPLEKVPILAYCEFRACYDFFKKELEIANSKRKEYIRYMFDGHLIEALSGADREASDDIYNDKK